MTMIRVIQGMQIVILALTVATIVAVLAPDASSYYQTPVQWRCGSIELNESSIPEPLRMFL
jgi:hypothetical protein